MSIKLPHDSMGGTVAAGIVLAVVLVVRLLVNAGGG